MKNTSTVKKVLKFIGKYRFLLFVSLLLTLIVVGLTLYLPILAGQIIDLIVGKNNVDFGGVSRLSVIGIVTIALTALFTFLSNVINNRITFNVVKDIREKAFAHIQKLPLSFLDTKQVGDTVSRIIADVDTFADGLLMGFTSLFSGFLTILGTLCFMLIINPVIAGIVVVLTPISLLVAAFIAKRTHKLFYNQSVIKGEQTALIDETLTNQKLVKAFTYENINCDNFDEINGRLHKASLMAIFFSSLVNPSTRFVNSLVYAAVALSGAFFAISNSITVGVLSAFLSYANQYTKPFNEISGVVTELQNALACAERVFALLEEETESSDAGLEELHDIEGNVELENVFFSYVADKSLIENLNLKVKKGQRIAIVGPTGCGKTTLINLLVRFYNLNSGKIMVDGNNITKVTRKSLRQNYGMVLQDSYIKSGTVKDNLLFAKSNATMEQIKEACKLAHADSFIRRLPNGYDTYLPEGGGNLSAGQKQLLCIARIMLKLPPIMILDEATSSIDTRTEQKIQNAFAAMMQGRTSFIVAHRLATIKNADVILVMRDGHIVEQGSHTELLAKKGFYHKLYNSQFEGEKE